MIRSAMQVFVKESNKALELYQKAFNTKAICYGENEDGTIIHAELDIYGQTMMISELLEEDVATGNTMMFCLHFGSGNESIVENIYDVLKDGANIISPLAPCDYSSLQTVLIDKYGVCWCIFV